MEELECGAGERKNEKGVLWKRCSGLEGIHLCSVYPYFESCKNRKGSSTYQGKPSAWFIFVPSNRLWNIILAAVCCLSFHTTTCAAILCHLEWGSGQTVRQWGKSGTASLCHLDMWFDRRKGISVHVWVKVLVFWTGQPVHLTHGHIIMFMVVSRCLLPTATQLQGRVARRELADKWWVTERQERNWSSQSACREKVH